MSGSVLFDAPGPSAIRRSRILSIVFAVVAVVSLALAAYQLWLGGAFYQDRWDIFLQPATWIGARGLLVGLGTTLSIAGIAAAGALVLGVILSILRNALSPWVRIPVTVVLEFFRGMPVLLMMLFIFIVFSTGAYWAVVWALIVYNGAIIGEALRAGMKSLPKGQRESGLAIGLTPLRTTLAIELPQAFRIMLPIILAQFIVLLKDTSLGYIVGSPELIRIGRQLVDFYDRQGGPYALSMFFVMLAIYLAINLTLSWLVRVLARRLQRPRRGGGNLDGSATEAIQLPTQTIRQLQDPQAEITRIRGAGVGDGGGG
ncbi:amino acid ABC transporter permease [Agrococcus beijingensis]|uniref:amino acid ABC transporter permease n=1 Tax=Agrococcus beijingensis TaxID=3068634 RepID=UPI0027411464|nr:amino acid ABC transporter permease [Agrococcus sp. REN33]